jgi:L-cysteine S-thiosulfotransferase
VRFLSGVAALALAASAAADEAPLRYRVAGDAVPAPLVATPGDAARGRELAFSRDANCLLCHSVPDAGRRPSGNLGPPLSGVGARLVAGQLRLRVVDPQRLDPESIMPAYYRVDGLERVAATLRGRPILTAQQIEDIVAYLLTLR